MRYTVPFDNRTKVASVASIDREASRPTVMANTPSPGLNIHANQGTRLVGSMVTLIILPTLFVIARLVSRKSQMRGFG
jgi:hypothetical protein